MRLGFGGAYAPNRFERVSTLVAASIQAAQRKFDATQPYPAATRRWMARRAALTARGGVLAGAGEDASG
eukprot:5962223-Pleurochrysis_carterae.AAC.1